MNTSLRGAIDIRRTSATVGCLAAALTLTACGGGGGGGSEPGSKSIDLVIGNSLPLSGISKELGRSGQKASQLAVAQIHRAIGETGADHTVRLAQRDEGATSESAVASARTLVDDEKASCLTGPWSADAIAQTAQDIAIPAKVLEISPVPTGADVTDLNDHDLLDSTALPQSLEGSALSKAVESDLGAVQGRSVNVAAGNDMNEDTIAQDFIQSWQDQDGTVGGKIVLPELAPSAAQAQQLTTGNPDAILVIEALNGFVQLAPSFSVAPGWDPSTAWGSDQLASPGLPRRIGASAVDGMRVLAPGAPRDDASTAFLDDFKAADPSNVALQPFAAQEFDATILCYLAAVAAGSSDGQQMADKLIDITAPGGTEYSWQQLPDAIRALERGDDIDYTGASGPLDMDVNGDPTGGVFDVYRYTPTGLEVAGEVSVSKPNPATP